MRTIRQAMLVSALLIAMLSGAGASAGCGGSGPTDPPVPSAALTGRITNILTSFPPASSTIVITPNGAAPIEFAVDATGFYNRERLPLGPARVQARAAGYQDYSANVPLNDGGNVHNIRMVPNP